MQKKQNVMPRISIRTVFYIIVAISAAVSGCIIIWPSQLSIDHASGTEQGMLMNSGTSMLPPSVVRQEERHLILKMGCSTTKTIRSNDSLEYLIKKRKLLRNIIVNDDYKLLYCYIPKVASTQWKKVMGVLSGKLPNIPLSEINADKTHERDVHQFLSDFPAAGIRNRLDTYTSFLFVRHPLERLVSGYRNKFAHAALDAYFPKHFAAGIKARYGSRNTTRSSDDSGKHVQERVTFEEFARWVSDPHPTAGARNEHWAPMVEQCYPCSIPYTVIGNMETLVDDAHYVLRTANVTTIVFPEGFHSGTRRIAGEMLTSLPDDVFRRVLRLYLEDFIVFGYHPSEVFVGNRTAEIIAMFENIPL